MKKFFIALSVLAALMLSVVPSQALIGMPDDVPGTDAIVPFICDISGTTGLNTLIVFTDVGLLGGIDFHYTIYTVRSVTVYDDDLTGTPGDIVPTDAFTEIGKMAPALRTMLEVDLDGDGVNDHYAGYIWYDKTVVNPPTVANPWDANSVIGQMYFVDLANGIAAATNIPMQEYADFLFARQPYVVNAAYQAAMAPALQYVEHFSAGALQAAKDLQSGLAFGTNLANGFGLYPRFYIQASGDATWLIFWKSANTIPGTLHVDFYDTDEVDVSSNIPLDDELTILDIEPYLPLSIFPATTYPKEGWIDIEWDLTPVGATPAEIAALRALEILGWTYQRATSGTGALNWTALFPMQREVFSVWP
jgi:hypothetical protein